MLCWSYTTVCPSVWQIIHGIKRVDYLPYRRTNHALAFYTILTSAELAQYEIFAKVSGVPFSSPARSEIFSTVNNNSNRGSIAYGLSISSAHRPD